MTSSVMLLIAASLVIPVAARKWLAPNDWIWPYLAVIVGLNLVSLVNAFEGPLPGAQWDALSLHRVAVSAVRDGVWPEFSIGTGLYAYMLSALYRIMGSHILVGQTLSVLTGAVALVFVGATSRSLGIERDWVRTGIILAVGLSPPFLFHSALTFREPFELAGLVVGTMFTVKASRESAFRWLVPATGGYLLMGMFHHVLFALSLILIAAAILFVYFSRRRTPRQHILVATLVPAGLVFGAYVATVLPVTSGNDYVKKLQQESSLVDAVISYRQSIERKEPRTSFDSVGVEDESWSPVIAFGKNYIHYLFKPYVTDIEYRVDFVAFASSSFRGLCFIVVAWLVLYQRRLNMQVLHLLFIYLLVTFVWSIGTTNYGQAFRHHAMTDWLLVVLAGYAVCQFMDIRKSATTNDVEGNGVGK